MKITKYFKKINASEVLINSVPRNCPECNEELEIVNEKHLSCTNTNCIGKKKHIFLENFNKIDVVGASTALGEKLWKIGIKDVYQIFDKENFTKEKLINSGEFKSGRSLDNFFDSIRKIEKIPIETIIISLGIQDLGKSISKQLAKYFVGMDYDFKGLTKVAISEFMERETELKEKIKFLENCEITIIYPEKPSESSVIFEMTGSPKSEGFKTKKDFIQEASQYGGVHGKLNKDCQYLVTHDKNSKSSKMSKAEKLGVKIVGYSELIEILKS